jgi:hypothetical protein
VVFCRYIATANYVGEVTRARTEGQALSQSSISASDHQRALPDDLAEAANPGNEASQADPCAGCHGLPQRGHQSPATFSPAVLHYDLPWNPNRLEQREGRVDRFGQIAKEVKACLLYGADNSIDGVVLDVLLRKVREIKRSTGINVPFPEDSQSIIDTITHALLLNPDRQIARRRDKHQIEFLFDEFDEAAKSKANVTRKVDEAAEREKVSRSIFAQNAIKAQDIEADLREVDEAIGDPKAVEEFVTATLNNLLGVQVIKDSQGLPHRHGQHAASASRDLLPSGDTSQGQLRLPRRRRAITISGRNHRFVEQLCQLVMGNTSRAHRQDAPRGRPSSGRARWNLKTTLLLFRCRNVIEQQKGQHQIVAEEMLLWGWRGTPQQKEFLDHAQAKALLASARATSDLTVQARAGFLENELMLLESLKTEFAAVAEQQSKRLVEAHERFNSLMDAQRFQVVYPVLPMDLLGVYILLPDGAKA